jgi:tetratricopeptide (TPR) repeat protein
MASAEINSRSGSDIVSYGSCETIFNDAFNLMNLLPQSDQGKNFLAILTADQFYRRKKNFRFSAGDKEMISAIKLLDRIIGHSPDHYYSHELKGVANIKLRRSQDALKDFTNAIRIEPNYSVAHHSRGVCYLSLKQYEKAIKDFSNSIKIDPMSSLAFHNIGKAKYYIKNYQGAVDDFDKALKLKPDYTPALILRGNSKSKLYDWSGAIEDYKKVIEIEPKDINKLQKRPKQKSTHWISSLPILWMRNMMTNTTRSWLV